jgi:thiamine biosynthesis protein ThiS
MSTIAVQLNGKEREIPGGLSVTGLLESLELNREILSRSQYPDTLVTEGDTLELVHFVGGG